MGDKVPYLAESNNASGNTYEHQSPAHKLLDNISHWCDLAGHGSGALFQWPGHGQLVTK